MTENCNRFGLLHPIPYTVCSFPEHASSLSAGSSTHESEFTFWQGAFTAAPGHAPMATSPHSCLHLRTTPRDSTREPSDGDSDFEQAEAAP
jgi:hypothetical protein